MSVRERNIKLLLEAVTYMATTETATCIITIEIVMCIMHCRKYHLHDCNRNSTGIISIKIVTHIYAAEIFTCISVAETSNCIIAIQTVTFITAKKKIHQHKCSKKYHQHNCNRISKPA